MKKRPLIVIRCVCVCAALCLGLRARPQTIPVPKIQTPNTASLGNFGDIPVDLSTGVPNISIPIHTLKYGSISVPISLRYHPGSVKVAQHPGWVGMGWDLESVGAITRRVGWIEDEAYPTSLLASTITYMPEPTPPTGNPPSGSELVNTVFWNTLTNFQKYYSPNAQGAVTDVNADEFSFNFLGYSGRFYYEGPTLGWQVVCDQPVKVETLTSPDPRMTIDQAFGTILGYPTIDNQDGTLSEDLTLQVIAGFKLTTPDGTQYYFGDILGNPPAVEFYTTYGVTGRLYGADSWLLVKIVDPDANEVDFHYTGSNPIVDLSFGLSDDSWYCQEQYHGLQWLPLLSMPGYGAAGGTMMSAVNLNVHGGVMHLPLYLDQISCPNETVNFTRGQASNCLRYPDAMLTYADQGNQTNTKFVLKILGDGDVSGGVPIIGINQIQWQQLNSISIRNGNGLLYRQFGFTYRSDPNKQFRLLLSALQESDNLSQNIGKYSFAYGPDIPSNVLYDGDYADHWGFYNNKTIANAAPNNADNVFNSIYGTKQPDPTLASYGVLASITYPTGGTTNFTWEAHDYSAVVSTPPGTTSIPRSILAPTTGFAGGARIKEVKSVLADGSLALDKKFYYVKGYTATHGSTGTTSSGVLNGFPTYFMTLSNRLSLFNQTKDSISLVALSSVGNYSYNSEGSYIGYDEVAEVNADGSYTRHYFTNYGPDINGVSHFDMQPDGVVGWLPGDNYYPMSTLESERGKPIGFSKYTPADVLVQKAVSTYRNDHGRFNSFSKMVTLSGIFSGCGAYDALVLSTATRKFSYVYYKTNEALTNYDQQGNNPITTSTSYGYNADNLLNSKTETDSKGETILTTYKYPRDFPTDASSIAMVNAHILDPVMQTAVYNSGSLVNLSNTPYYSPSSGKYKPQSVQLQVATNPIETRQQFYQYDSYGNIGEMSKVNDVHTVYLWGYHGQYPVAKIENTTYSIASSYIAQSILDNPPDDNTFRGQLNSLRGITGALVTTYTYLPLVGITSETDPKGQTTKYQYDSFGRLQMIMDHDGNILKTFSYQYQVTQ